MANRIQIQEALRLKYNRVLFAKEILSPIFGNGFSLHTSAVDVSQKPNQTEARVIQKVQVYGKIVLDDTTEVNCYEILLQPKVRIEQSKVAIQHYVRKMLTSGQAALINFVSPTYENTWRLTLVAKDSIFTEKGVKEKTTHAKRFTFLLGPSETCKTAAERFEALSTEKQTSFELLVKAFSVERLSKIFFDEYKKHYDLFVEYLTNSNFKTTAFKNDDKAIRDFSKKLLGRIVFLYFVQKKGWMGASNAEYTDGDTNFMMNLFTASGGNESFYSVWLNKLFFDTLNTKERKDDFALPNGKKVKIPYLNGGLFDKEEHDDNLLVFKPILFHNPENADDPTQRGFLDFLNSFNFTVFEDSPEEHTIAVDPEMLGHIFENLLEDNKDKGAFYTPKEIVHYMCQESLIEYLATHLAKEYTLYKSLGGNQLELFGNQARIGQLSLLEELGDKALNREHVEHIVSTKGIDGLSTQQLKRIDALLDSVRICDPAIGSGAFPMGLLQEIFAIKEVIAYQLDIPWQPATVKENIIQNSIYGVDIEKGAVDIARLRFWLSLVVDEDKPKALPNLDYKIVVGNSLVSKFENEIIEIDWSNDITSVGVFGQENRLKTMELLKTISSKQTTYFHVENSDKKVLAAQIRGLKIDLLINQLDQMVKTKGIDQVQSTAKGSALEIQTDMYLKTEGWKKTIKYLNDLKKNPNTYFEHFDWRLDFPEMLNPLITGESIGFDIVIGNPPYLNVELISKELKEIFAKQYETTYKRYDIYALFFELGIKKIMKNESVLAFIIPSQVFNNLSYKKLRDLILKNNWLKEVCYLGDKIFETANNDVCILFLKKPYNKDIRLVNRLNFHKPEINTVPVNYFDKFGGVISVQSSENTDTISDKIFNPSFAPIKKNFDVFQGIVTGNNDVFLPTEEQIIENRLEKELLHPILLGRDFEKYYVRNAERQILYIDKRTNIEQFPNALKWLSPYKESLMQRREAANGSIPWFSLQWARDKTQLDYTPKILVQRTRNQRLITRIVATIDNEGMYGMESIIFLVPTKDQYSVYYLLAILNSSIINYLYQTKFLNVGIKAENLKDTPIPNLAKPEQVPFERIVTYLLWLKKQELTDPNDELIFKYFEQILDGLVFEAYLPEMLNKSELFFRKHLMELPDLDAVNDKLDTLRSLFVKFYQTSHPLRFAVNQLVSISEIKTVLDNQKKKENK